MAQSLQHININIVPPYISSLSQDKYYCIKQQPAAMDIIATNESINQSFHSTKTAPIKSSSQQADCLDKSLIEKSHTSHIHDSIFHGHDHTNSHADDGKVGSSTDLYRLLVETQAPDHLQMMQNHLTDLCGEVELKPSEKQQLKMTSANQENGGDVNVSRKSQKPRGEQDLRRVVFAKDSKHFHYLPYMCFQSEKQCVHGKRCALAHKQAQIQFHPLYYKTTMCKLHPLSKQSERDERPECPYAHNKSSLRKTKNLCKFGCSMPLGQQFPANDQDKKQDSITSKQSSKKNSFELQKSKDLPRIPSNISNKIHSSPNGINNPYILNPHYGQHLITHLDLKVFKTQSCPTPQTHNPKRCVYYHDENKDRRRLPHSYTAQICQFIAANQDCPNGDHCSYAHNRVEQFYHPDKYKTKFCTTCPSGSQLSPMNVCEYGNYCAFAHNQNDIRIDLLHHYKMDMDFYLFHYKTVWCPFNQAEHDRSSCVYAHNWQDFRRKWHFYFYDAVQCDQWNSKTYITNYNQGCPSGRMCKKAHGWKELQFHPYFYKTSSCKYGTNCSKFHCPFFHTLEEKRQTNYEGFQIVPKTRATCFQTAAYVGDLLAQGQKSLQSDYN